MVFWGLVMLCRFAVWPTRTSPLSAKATIDGVVRPPSAFSMIFAFLPSITATQEFVVPRSMPIALAMIAILYDRALHAAAASAPTCCPCVIASRAILARHGRTPREGCRDHSLDLPLPDFRPTNPVPGRFDSNVRLAPAGAMTIPSTSHFPITDQRIPCPGRSTRTYDWRHQGAGPTFPAPPPLLLTRRCLLRCGPNGRSAQTA